MGTPDPVLLCGAVFFIAIDITFLKEQIERLADHIRPYFAYPWQHVFVQGILWMMALMALSALLFIPDWKAYLLPPDLPKR